MQIDNLTVKLSNKIILNNINLSFNNCIYGLLGPNGAGKTTLLRTICGYYNLKNGRIKNIQNKNIGYMPQVFNVFKNLTCFEILEYYCILRKVPKNKQKDEIYNAIHQVNLEEKINAKAKSLSGGMVRRLGLAQALLYNPDIIILDEPTVGLDPEERMRFKNLLKDNYKNKLVIISSHIIDDIKDLCNEITVLNKGNLIFCGNQSMLCNIAKNKVYEVESDKLSNNHYIVKSYSSNNKNLNRIISKEIESIKMLEPDIEDGYMCLVKGI